MSNKKTRSSNSLIQNTNDSSDRLTSRQGLRPERNKYKLFVTILRYFFSTSIDQ